MACAARILSLALFPLLPIPASAEQWLCWYHPSREQVVLCERLLSVGTFAGSPSLRVASLAQPLWESQPARPFRAVDERMKIPLLARPTDLSRLEVLARDVMCARRAECTVDFTLPRAYRAQAD